MPSLDLSKRYNFFSPLFLSLSSCSEKQLRYLHWNATAPKISYGQKDKCKLFSSTARCSFLSFFFFFFLWIFHRNMYSFVFTVSRLSLFFFNSSRLNLSALSLVCWILKIRGCFLLHSVSRASISYFVQFPIWIKCRIRSIFNVVKFQTLFLWNFLESVHLLASFVFF